MPFRGDDESAALRARRLHVLFDHLPALIAYWDRDCRNVIANAAYVEWFGWTPEDMPGVHIREVLGAEVYEKNLPFITGVLHGEEQFFERTLVDMSGRVRHTQASYVPDVIDGVSVGFFVLVTDVTPHVEAQRAMDEAQRLAKVGSWTFDLGTGVLTWSDELYRMYGADPESFLPTADVLMEGIDPRDIERVRAQLAEARETGEDYDLTYRTHAADGSLRELHSHGHPQSGPDGKVVRLAGTMQDVTATNAAARELSRVNAELRKLNQLYADVLVMLGHDVRAPLTVILGYLESLTEGWEVTTESERREQLDRAFRGARRLHSLVDDILAMATVDSGRIVANPMAMSAVEHVREAVDGVGPGFDITITTEGDPQAFADPFHVRQVVSNLVTNAIRYGEPPIEIHIGHQGDDSVAITVTDHGPGIPEDQVGSIFERFVGRAASVQPAGLGTSTGFGLYIAAGLTTANSGSLTYDPTGPGALFRLRLPRADTTP